jgi:hypothetical protein
LETAFVSSTGKCGVIISHEGHAVAGGKAPFVETLTCHFPPVAAGPEDALYPATEQVVAFLREVKQSWVEPMKWLPSHLAHVYGSERADALLHQFGFVK